MRSLYDASQRDKCSKECNPRSIIIPTNSFGTQTFAYNQTPQPKIKIPEAEEPPAVPEVPDPVAVPNNQASNWKMGIPTADDPP
jgi:hypothetical protein